jgi:hypothetical protein
MMKDLQPPMSKPLWTGRFRPTAIRHEPTGDEITTLFCVVWLHPLEKRRLCTAHPNSGRSGER